MDSASLVVLTVFFLTTSYGQTQAKEQSAEAVGAMVSKLEQLLSDVSSLRKSVDELDSDIQNTIPSDDECSFGFDENCNIMNMLERLSASKSIAYPSNPGKRTIRDTSAIRRTRRSVNDLLRKRQMLRALRDILSNAERVIKAERKRSCSLNLGFHCQTDEYSSIADLYDFLASDISPGKRKRSAQAKDNRS